MVGFEFIFVQHINRSILLEDSLINYDDCLGLINELWKLELQKILKIQNGRKGRYTQAHF